MISKDIEELCKEKFSLEANIAQREGDIKTRAEEIKNLQTELNTLATTLKQLETQKGEAQKRLNDLKSQVDTLRTQAVEQADLVYVQETDLNVKKEQLEGLKLEEQMLEQQKADSSKQLDSMTFDLQETQLNISQVKALVTQLQEQMRQINDAIRICDTAVNNSDVTLVPDTILNIKPEFEDAGYKKFGTGLQGDRDAFGCDPFAVLHAPVRDNRPPQLAGAPARPQSPSPALPPKKSKDPPPRPAPPRPSMPPSVKKTDIFAGDPFNEGFADFSSFDSKFSCNDTISSHMSFKAQDPSLKGLDFIEDPFKNYRYEDPFNITFNEEDDKQMGTNKKRNYRHAHKNSDACGFTDSFDHSKLKGRQSVPLPSKSCRISVPLGQSHLTEEQQMMWAKMESIKLEEDRNKIQEKEDAELALAISLSKTEIEKQT